MDEIFFQKCAYNLEIHVYDFQCKFISIYNNKKVIMKLEIFSKTVIGGEPISNVVDISQQILIEDISTYWNLQNDGRDGGKHIPIRNMALLCILFSFCHREVL